MSREVGFEGIGVGPYVYFKSALVKGTDEDKLVKLSVNATVVLCADGDDFIGIVRVIDQFDKAAGVQIDGFVENFPCKHGAVPVLGWDHIVAADGPSAVKTLAAAAGSPQRLVVKTDDTTHLCAFRLNQ